MSLTPRLNRKLHETLGDEAAEDLVTWMQEREDALKDHRDTVRADIAELRQEMRAGFASLRTDMANLRADVIKWSFVFWIGSVTAITLANALR